MASCATRLPETSLNLVEPVSTKKSLFTDDCQNTETSFRCVKVVDVYDGDTIFIDLPDQHPLFGKRIGVRIYGIDTPEMKTKNSCEKTKAHAVKSMLEYIIKKSDRIDVIDVQRDKFFRILGVVLVDGKSVADELIKRKLAYPYFGEKKPKRDWCK